MKTLFHKWRGFQIAAAIAATTLTAHSAVDVKTLGGGPSQSNPARAGSANGNTFSAAMFSKPSAIAIDTNGNLYIADRANNKIRKVTVPGAGESVTTTFATRVPAPVGVGVDASNRVYVVTFNDGKLRVFNSAGILQTNRTVVGLRKPTALAVSPNGTAYVTEQAGNVKQISPDGTTKPILSGLKNPQGIALLHDGFLAVSDTGHNAIFRVDPSDHSTNNITLSVIAGGSGDPFSPLLNGAGYLDGPGAQAQFNQPWNLAVAPNGLLVVADRKNHRVRYIDTRDTNYFVRTLFGVPQSQWQQNYPGWADGPGATEEGPGTAAVREPLGIAVNSGGTVFDTEGYWNLIRQATGGPLSATNGTGNTTNIIGSGTNAIVVIGTNVISFGFESGEASSDFVGAAGQSFYAPVTLQVAPGQKVYSFQMSLSATGETGVALNALGSGFMPMVEQPLLQVTTNAENRDGVLVLVLVTNVIGYVAIQPNYGFQNTNLNMLGIGWIERFERTNLYNTLAQDLIRYSGARDRLFLSSEGQVVLGAYQIQIPSSATTNDSFRIAIHNASGVSDGLMTPVPLLIPTNGSLGAGALNTIKRVVLGSRPYIVGDSTPFRWFNAGDFGDQTLRNSDVIELFQTAASIPSVNRPPDDSDVFDALDSSDGSSGTISPNDIVSSDSINAITTGDGLLNVDDVFVTFRRSLDPSLKWFARYWSNGVRHVVEVPNTLLGGFGIAAAAPVVVKSLSHAKSVSLPTASLSVDDRMTTPGETFQLPIRISTSGGYPVRVMMLNVTVEAMDGSPALTSPIQLQTAPGFHAPELSDSHGLNNLAGAWLDNTVSGVSGNSVLGLLTIQIPASAGPRAAYRVHFDHFSASPNGMALFDSYISGGLLLLSDRSASTWGDGIADAWRLRYFGSISAPGSGSGDDADGDGVINADEYVNGTDPTDILSK